MGNLSYLLMCASAEENFRNLPFAFFVLSTVFGQSTWALGARFTGLETEKEIMIA